MRLWTDSKTSSRKTVNQKTTSSGCSGTMFTLLALLSSSPFLCPKETMNFAVRAYNAGVTQDQVAIKAVAKLPNSVVATIWYPITEQQRPQGWEHGLRFALNKPLLDASEVRLGWRWRVRQITPGFKRYCGHPHINQVILSVNEIA